jgi:predicted transposase YbfD/YdcC
VGEKTNEIPEAVAILEEANLDAETVVTADAMHTQTKTAELIKKKTLTTSSPLKGTKEIFKKAILEETPEESWSVPTSVSEFGHGRIETRTIRVAPLEPGELDFPGARSIAIVERSFIDKKSGKESKETIGYISSLVHPDPRELLAIIRYHWTIENSFFHVRDRTYREDQQLTRTGNGPTNLALLRNLSISINNLLGKKPIQELQSKVNRDPASFLAKFKLIAPFAQL